MKRNRGTPTADNSAMVPMADMLSNTVGIMLFILAFTVLHTQGVLIPKRLPMERKTDESPLYYACVGQRLIPLNDELQMDLLGKLGKPSFATAEKWVARFNKARAEDEFFTVVGHGNARFNWNFFQRTVQLDLSAEYQPKPNVGDTADSLARGHSVFDETLQGLAKKDKFVYFFVYPESIGLFQKAREYAESRYGMGSGWSPVAVGKSIRFNLTGTGGIRPGKQ